MVAVVFMVVVVVAEAAHEMEVDSAAWTVSADEMLGRVVLVCDGSRRTQGIV